MALKSRESGVAREEYKREYFYVNENSINRKDELDNSRETEKRRNEVLVKAKRMEQPLIFHQLSEKQGRFEWQ